MGNLDVLSAWRMIENNYMCNLLVITKQMSKQTVGLDVGDITILGLYSCTNCTNLYSSNNLSYNSNNLLNNVTTLENNSFI